MHLVGSWFEVIPAQEVGSSAILVGDPVDSVVSPSPCHASCLPPRHQLGPGGLASHPVHGDGDAGRGPPRGRVEDVRGHWVGVRPHGARHRAAH